VCNSLLDGVKMIWLNPKKKEMRETTPIAPHTWTRFFFLKKDFGFLLILGREKITHTYSWWLLDLWLKGSLKGGARILLWRFFFSCFFFLGVFIRWRRWKTPSKNLSSRRRKRNQVTNHIPPLGVGFWTIRSGREGGGWYRNVSWNTVARHAEKKT
jgi:hypothetical protein